MSENTPAWKVRDEKIAEAFRHFIDEREEAWRVYFETVKKTPKKAT